MDDETEDARDEVPIMMPFGAFRDFLRIAFLYGSQRLGNADPDVVEQTATEMANDVRKSLRDWFTPPTMH
jgi:hypothetical protein